jgi:hypothetical protein
MRWGAEGIRLAIAWLYLRVVCVERLIVQKREVAINSLRDMQQLLTHQVK